MLLSSCVVWRHLRFEDFRHDCPHGDERLQRLIWERLDESLAWLESTTGVRPLWDDTENPRTTGRRYDPGELTAALAREVGRSGCAAVSAGASNSSSQREASRCASLASGGCSSARTPGAKATGSIYARGLGAATSGELDELYARAMPAPPARIGEADYVAPLTAVRRSRARHERARRGVLPAAPCLARERPRAGDRATARRDGVVRARRSDRSEGARCTRSRGRGVATDGGVRVHVAARGHAHAGRASRRRAGPSPPRGRHPHRGASRCRSGRRRRRERRLREWPRSGARARPRRR